MPSGTPRTKWFHTAKAKWATEGDQGGGKRVYKQPTRLFLIPLQDQPTTQDRTVDVHKKGKKGP